MEKELTLYDAIVSSFELGISAEELCKISAISKEIIWKFYGRLKKTDSMLIRDVVIDSTTRKHKQNGEKMDMIAKNIGHSVKRVKKGYKKMSEIDSDMRITELEILYKGSFTKEQAAKLLLYPNDFITRVWNEFDNTKCPKWNCVRVSPTKIKSLLTQDKHQRKTRWNLLSESQIEKFDKLIRDCFDMGLSAAETEVIVGGYQVRIHDIFRELREKRKQEKIEEIKDYYIKGYTITQTSELTGYTECVVRDKYAVFSHSPDITSLRNEAINKGTYRIEIHPTVVTEDRLKKLRELYIKGLTKKEILKEIQMSKPTCAKYLPLIISKEDEEQRELNKKRISVERLRASQKKYKEKNKDILKIMDKEYKKHKDSVLKEYRDKFKKGEILDEMQIKLYNSSILSLSHLLFPETILISTVKEINPHIVDAIEELFIMWENGESIQNVMEYFELSPDMEKKLYRRLQQTDSQIIRVKRKEQARQERNEKIKECYEKGLMPSETVEKLDLDYKTVERLFTKLSSTESKNIRMTTIAQKELEIYNMYLGGVMRKYIAEAFGVSFYYVENVINKCKTTLSPETLERLNRNKKKRIIK